MTIRVLLADDQALLRSTFKILFEASDGIEVIGEAADGQEAVALARQLLPDLVLMDLRMPRVDGIEATRQITSDPNLTGTRVLVLTTYETDELVVGAIQAGASGYLGKGIDAAGLVEGVRTVAAGEALLSPAATTALISDVIGRPRAPAPKPGRQVADLTDREREITSLAAKGMSNSEIARQLFISPATAKTHVNRAMMKTGSRDRAQLVVFAYRNGLVDPASEG